MSKARPSIDERLTFDTTSETTPAIDAEKGHGNGHANGNGYGNGYANGNHPSPPAVAAEPKSQTPMLIVLGLSVVVNIVLLFAWAGGLVAGTSTSPMRLKQQYKPFCVAVSSAAADSAARIGGALVAVDTVPVLAQVLRLWLLSYSSSVCSSSNSNLAGSGSGAAVAVVSAPAPARPL